ncbi:MAG: hypothetical protein UY76_C0040G0006 [Candidatus Uhrbacteria bacterium GW2011_GWA2_52_8d]|uniref:Uncharacterized protein n=1 Tax=Candidatus Uhrbacteria bacterium GW2011_GWA2_52_8d TaxID=1618979 RepID=A0A0G1XMK0_9BACT|nr:MAG: hypothetical protein UY76_C0040G0006 [Candidatus Uhrbacteria bacterium GW2011_GWA2_52_8d]
MIRSLSVILMAIALFLCVSTAFAQQPTPPKTYVVAADQLTPGQIAQLEAGETLTTVETVGKYAGVGKEIGEGVSGALGALNEEASKFGDTRVGHFTMAMIAWKIMGDDIVAVSHDMIGYVVGIPFFFLASLAILWSYRRKCIPHTVLAEKGAGIFGTRKYETVDPNASTEGWDASQWAIAHGVMFILIIFVSSLMIFG